MFDRIPMMRQVPLRLGAAGGGGGGAGGAGPAAGAGMPAGGFSASVSHGTFGTAPQSFQDFDFGPGFGYPGYNYPTYQQPQPSSWSCKPESEGSDTFICTPQYSAPPQPTYPVYWVRPWGWY